MEELIEKAKNDDKRAFSELIIAIEKELYLIAKTRLSNDDDIGDAIQETIYKSYKKWNFKGQSLKFPNANKEGQSLKFLNVNKKDCPSCSRSTKT